MAREDNRGRRGRKAGPGAEDMRLELWLSERHQERDGPRETPAGWRLSPTRSERTRVCTAAIALAMIKTQIESVSERKTEDVRNAQLL